MGNSEQEIQSIPAEGLGCGNPTAFAKINSGETVLDLGSGGGLMFSCISKSWPNMDEQLIGKIISTQVKALK